ncbi:MAG TPA: asparagine synthase (glutamine-hydrolyzing) [Candidatus Acidoferrales bacterium]|nr:asparagine synthase (glutamine-hydrolyzing) [Candidatus Acidoferrales bacterium]
MCGIAGLIAPDLAPPERLELVRRMVRVLRHRGPSGEALWDGGECALGLARLAIVAPNEPARVLESETGDVVAVVNGEVYNHDELLAQLRGRGHVVPSGPDTAVLPHVFEERGDEFPEALDGMFAAALWDRTRRTLTLARDRAGEKPLFVTSSRGRFAFASEPAALAELPWLSRDPSPRALARYLVHGCFAGPDAAWAALRQLPPGHTLVVHAGRETLRRYWRPWDVLLTGRPSAHAGDAPALTREALGAAVLSRIPGEVPFGVFLSGGVDSGLVATLAARARQRTFPTFSMRIEHRGYDESGFARRVAESIHSRHHELVMTAREGLEAFHAWAATMDQPLGDPSVLPTWALARLASESVPVVLTGEGGDELFAGYPTYLGHRHAALADDVPGPLAAAALAIARRLRPRHHHVTLAHLVERFLGTRGLLPFERHLAWFGTARAGEALALLAPELRAAASNGEALAHARHLERVLSDMRLFGSDGRPPVVAYQLLDFETYLCGDLLTKVDRCTMAHGVESRAPFLRPSLIEFALALPESARLRGTSGKWALKQAARSLLPPDLLARRKQGFSPPFSAWARGPMRPLVLETLSPARVERAGILDPAAVSRLVEGHLQAREDRGRTLWAVLSLQCWAERWVVGGASAAPAAADPPLQTAAVN